MGLYERLCVFPFCKDEEEEKEKKHLKELVKKERTHTEIHILRRHEKYERRSYE